MDFASFILSHDGDDLGALALSRGRYSGEVPDFDLALTTLECRRKLRLKVPQWYAVPSLRFPVRLSAEQCSSEETALYKAGVIPHGAAVADLTGGLGVDSWAFSQVASEVLYNEMNTSLAAAAEHNFKELGVGNVEVRSYEVKPGSVPGVLDGFTPDLIFLDPARRASDGRKVFRLEDCQPNVLELLPELFAAAPLLLLKLSPMADISLVCKQLGSVREVHVVAADGECKELLLLLERGYSGEWRTFVYENGAVLAVDQVQGMFGRGAITGGGPGPDYVSQNGPSGIIGGPGPGGKITPGPKINLFEPGKGLLKAGAFELPCKFGLTKLGRHTHVYVGDAVPEELRPFGKCFEIIEVVPLNNKIIKELGRRYPRAEVTARNIPLTSDDLRRRLGCHSGGDVHLFGVHIDALDGNFLVIAK